MMVPQHIQHVGPSTWKQLILWHGCTSSQHLKDMGVQIDVEISLLFNKSKKRDERDKSLQPFIIDKAYIYQN